MLTDLDYELLSAYIDGALAESDRAALELRLQSDMELRRELEDLRATVTLINNLPLHKAPRDFTLDARYSRRSTSFLTSATFSAISSAAAILLLAVGVYLFTGKEVLAPASVSDQVAQSAFNPTAPSTELDKAANGTPPPPMGALTGANIPSDTAPETTGLTANDAIVQESVTAQSTPANGVSPLFQRDTEQPTESISDGYSAAPSQSDESQAEGRTKEATATLMNQLYAPQPSSGAGGAAQPAPAEQSDANAASAIAAPPLPATSVALPTLTPLPSVTKTLTSTAAASATPLATVAPPSVEPPPAVAKSVSSVSISLVLIILGVVFLVIAIGTTLVRRRNRL